MKLELPNGRVVKIGAQYGNEKPVLVRPLPPEIADKPFKSLTLRVTLMDGDTELGTISGTSYCSPADQFSRKGARERAMKRLFNHNKEIRLLSKDECRTVSPVLLGGRR